MGEAYGPSRFLLYWVWWGMEVIMPYPAMAIAATLIGFAVDEGRPIVPRMATMLAYYVHGWALSEGLGPAIDEPFLTLGYGVELASVRDALRRWGGRPVTSLPPCPPVPLDPKTQLMVAWVWSRYGGLKPLLLSSMTRRRGGPWWLCKDLLKGSTIPDDVIQGHFSVTKCLPGGGRRHSCHICAEPKILLGERVGWL